MTGTPAQNGADDIGALIRFLRLPILGEVANFRKHISGKTMLKNRPSENDYTNLRLLLSSICLRRNKSVLKLPDIRYEVRRPEFSYEERQAYNSLILACKRALDRAHGGIQTRAGIMNGHGTETAAASSNRILGALLRLRLFCNQGLTLKPARGNLPSDPYEILGILEQKWMTACGECGREVTDLDLAVDSTMKPKLHLTACHVLVCEECIPDFLAELRHPQPDGTESVCQFCGDHDNGDNLMVGQPAMPAPDGEGDSDPKVTVPSKLRALVADLVENAKHEKRFVLELNGGIHATKPAD